MKPLFVKQDGNDVVMPDGGKFRMDQKAGADQVFNAINTYGARCLAIGSGVTLCSMTAGILFRNLWDEEIKPRIEERRAKKERGA